MGSPGKSDGEGRSRSLGLVSQACGQPLACCLAFLCLGFTGWQADTGAGLVQGGLGNSRCSIKWQVVSVSQNGGEQPQMRTKPADLQGNCRRGA